MSKIQLINDNIHKHFEVSNLFLKIINTPEFQRLRNIKQLGFNNFVYPTAEHSRFCHSIGTYYITRKLVEHLQKIQPELEISDHLVDLISIAGLCHDIGHCCYSHTFEHWVNKKGKQFKHEDMSVKLFRRIYDKYLQDDLSEDDVELICNAITPPSDECHNNFIYQIVCNKNGLDTDKYDYIRRDALNCNKPISFEPNSIIMNCRVINNELCFHLKECYNIYTLFNNRYSMHKQVYSHKTCSAIEMMFMDYMDEYIKKINILDDLDDIDKYIKLTDSIFPQFGVSEECDKIINRIYCRDIYKMVYEIIFPSNKYLTGNDIIYFHFVRSLKENLPKDIFDHVRITKGKIDYGMGDKNPIDRVKFYDNTDLNKSFNVKKENVSTVLPEYFVEYYIRVYSTYSKSGDYSKEISMIKDVCNGIIKN